MTVFEHMKAWNSTLNAFRVNVILETSQGVITSFNTVEFALYPESFIQFWRLNVAQKSVDSEGNMTLRIKDAK